MADRPWSVFDFESESTFGTAAPRTDFHAALKNLKVRFPVDSTMNSQPARPTAEEVLEAERDEWKAKAGKWRDQLAALTDAHRRLGDDYRAMEGEVRRLRWQQPQSTSPAWLTPSTWKRIIALCHHDNSAQAKEITQLLLANRPK